MSLFSKKPAFLMAALGAAGITSEQVDAAFAKNDTNFLVEESETRAQMAADLATAARQLNEHQANVKVAHQRETALASALGALGIKPEDVLAEGADPAAIAKAALKTASAREAAETLSKHGIKPIAGATAPATGSGKPEPKTLGEYRQMQPHEAVAFFKAGGTLVD